MKAVIKRLVCAVLLVMVLISAVPASALDIDFDQIDWDVIGGMFDIPEDQLEDLKDLVSNLDEESLDKIVSEALGDAGSSDESEEPDSSDAPDVSDEPDAPGSGIVIPVLKNYVAVIGGSGVKAFYPTLSEAIDNASKSEVIFVIDARGLDDEVDAACQIIFDKSVDPSALKVADDLAVIEGSYVFGKTSYNLYMISRVSAALETVVKDLDKVNDGYSAVLVGSDNKYTLTLTVNVSDIADLASGVGATAGAVAEAIMPAFPLFDNIVVGQNKRVIYDGTYFNMDQVDALIGDLLAKQTKGGIYNMAFYGGDTLYTFPMSMQYQEGKAVAMDVVVKVNATASQMSAIKAGMRKTYDRLYIEDLGGGAYTVNANAIGLFKAIAEEAGLLPAYGVVTEDGVRAVLDDVKVEWICKAVMAYNGSAYASQAAALQSVIGKFMQTEEYAACKDNYLGDCYTGNGVYVFSFDGSVSYSSMLRRVAEKTASFGYDYAKLAEMCKNDTDITRSFNVVLTAYGTTRLESANDVIEGVLDALDAVSGDTAYVIERDYTDGVISGLNFVVQPGSAKEMLDVATKRAVADVLASLVPVCLVFDEAAINGKTVFDRDGSIAWKDTVLDLYNDYDVTFTYIATLETKTVLTFDLHLENGEVALDIPVSVTLGVSDVNFAKLKKVAAKLASIIAVDGEVTAADDRFAASVDLTVDLSDDVDQILEFVLPTLASSSYKKVRSELHKMSLNDLLEMVTLDKMQAVAEKAGVSDQFNKLVEKVADRFGLDTSAPCNYHDLIAIIDANYYYQTYVKERLEALLDKAQVEELLNVTLGDYYRNNGTYTASVGETYDGVAPAAYADRVINALKARFVGENAEKLVAKLGFDSVDAMIDAVKNRYAAYYYATYDVDVNLTLILFDVYTVTFVDENGVIIEKQEVVAGDSAIRPDYHGKKYKATYIDENGKEVTRTYAALNAVLGSIMSDLEITLIPDHVYDDGVVTEDPTCVSTGTIEYTCMIEECSHSYTDVVAVDPDNHVDLRWDVVTEAACETAGEKAEKCYACNTLTGNTEVIEALGHIWGDWKVVSEPNCTDAGSKERVCERGCGETAAIPALGHTLITETYAASCTEKGVTVEICSVCDYYNISWQNALGHELEFVEVILPTCLEDGSIVYVCTVCKEVMTITLPATDHISVHKEVTKQVTCTEDGEIVTKCLDCNTVLDTEVVVATGHKAGEWYVTVEPTCTTKGTMALNCTVCGELVMTKQTDAYGHVEGIWKTTVEPTCTAEGKQIKNCAVCGVIVKTASISMLSHNYETTETEGYDCHHPHITTVACTVCGDVAEEDVTDIYYPPLKDGMNDVAFLSEILVVKVEKMTVAEFKSNFYGAINVYDKDGNELKNADYVGTDGKFVCAECGTEFTIAVIGDINGDGIVNPKDYMMIKRYYLGTLKLDGAALAAADVNVDLTVNPKDYMMVKLYVLDRYNFYTNVPDWDDVSDLITKAQ